MKRIVSVLLIAVMVLATIICFPTKTYAMGELSVNTSVNTKTYEVEVTWNAYSGADHYELRLLCKNDSNHFIQEGFARKIESYEDTRYVYKSFSFTTPENGTQDAWEVEVWACNAVDEVIAKGTSKAFSTGMPKLDAPSVNLGIDGYAYWHAVDSATNYTIKLYGRSTDSGKGTLLASSGINYTCIDLSGFMTVNYQYRVSVIAYDKQNEKHMASDLVWSDWVVYEGEPEEDPCAHEDTRKVVKKGTFSSDGYVKVYCNQCEALLKTVPYPQIGSVTLSSAMVTYNGKERSPSVYVKDKIGEMISKSYFTISIPSGRTNVGTYTYKVVFKSRYSGTKYLDFIINPKGTSITSTSGISKGFNVYWTPVSQQVDGYEIQFSTSSSYSSSKTVTVSGASAGSKKITGRTANKKYYVRIRTYKDVNGVRYYSDWSSSKSVTTK